MSTSKKKSLFSANQKILKYTLKLGQSNKTISIWDLGLWNVIYENVLLSHVPKVGESQWLVRNFSQSSAESNCHYRIHLVCFQFMCHGPAANSILQLHHHHHHHHPNQNQMMSCVQNNGSVSAGNCLPCQLELQRRQSQTQAKQQYSHVSNLDSGSITHISDWIQVLNGYKMTSRQRIMIMGACCVIQDTRTHGIYVCHTFQSYVSFVVKVD